MVAFLRGLALLMMTPPLWGYVWRPLLLAALLYIGIFLVGAFWLAPAAAGFLGGGGWLWSVLTVGGSLLFIIVWLFLSSVIYLAIAGLFSGLMWDSLSQRVEVALYGHAPSKSPGCLIQIWDGFLRVLIACLILIGSFLCGWLGLLVVLFAAGLLSLFDFTGPAYLRRGYFFPLQIRRVLRAPGAPGFALCCGVTSLLPVVFVLLLPAMVAGGTILCREAEGH